MVHGVSSFNAYFSSDLVQFDRGGTTQNLGRIVPEVGADRPSLGRTWGGSTRGGSTLGRIVCKPVGITEHFAVHF